ncbi:MBL fold metallo-hydrolase [Mycobacterium sherrisii]|uniref:MBL fold metallo-hydrolase n=1 Tax=Mycobacterium sherrisii TaxID=243061 RepID=A0A1E3SNE5_9MYCO|nr:MBL fold metallo-hydrolase [Mycobacterium sherrisii]MCV7030932.1 MBL fold metallo-hydrolase [Mycobacterium sherrisii]MEC4762003.1 MBL fold metallo-hydrolase [Mycobacterium sherrisii]ODR03705.1 MBL fold metallo-hydrolase [Mycobacterium sherrisii]ORW73006.1 MBL fold metallo-hydrolase [Mycobacterium sherrisii]
MTSLQLPAGETADFTEGDVYFIGNATTLIRFGGLTILTDPAFLHKGEHVYLGHGIWARREVEPACQIADLPPIDLIVLSHYHGDHFDDVAARELDNTLPIVSTADAVDKLKVLGFDRGHPLDTWESLQVHKGEMTLTITAMPAKHAAEDAVEELLMPVNGHLLDFSRDGELLYRLYITGDTMLVDSLADIPRRYPDIDLGLIHTGGTTFLVTVVTMTGEQAVRAVEITKPRTAIPIHYNDFSVFLSGLDDFQRAAEASSATTDFVYLAHGDSYTFRPCG